MRGPWAGSVLGRPLASSRRSCFLTGRFLHWAWVGAGVAHGLVFSYANFRCPDLLSGHFLVRPPLAEGCSAPVEASQGPASAPCGSVLGYLMGALAQGQGSPENLTG